MKIAGVEFPRPFLNALRNSELAVFAGAGVSMGPPAGLPDFSRLAIQIAEGTGKSRADSETEDQFLGRLYDHGTKVNELAAEILQRNAPEPTALHLNLLRLFQEPGEVRVVTTNFDELFEKAALDYFNPQPSSFQAPALPLGSRFQGIVHLHGSVKVPAEMVLTHRDFGSAYLTESDGWARRFLIDLFAKYTTLFVGYSHSDSIMTYLTPSLPPEDNQKRFALVGEKNDDIDHWRRMGIEPVTFPQADSHDFQKLEEAVASLANFRRRRVLDWKSEIDKIASGEPPIMEDEAASTIDHALTELELTRFFVKAATSPEWIDWLDRRGHLDPLFADEDLDERNSILSHWIASQFVDEHSDALFQVISRQGGKLNAHLWDRLAWKLGTDDSSKLTKRIVSRWVHFLASCVPPHPEKLWLTGLARTCAKVGAYKNLLQMYDMIMAPRHQVRPASEWGAAGNRPHSIRKLWDECLEPNLSSIGHSLLERTTNILEERYSAKTAWEEDDETWDADNYRRSAIEPHEQDRIPYNIDAVIDVARNCLKWLATNDQAAIGAWCDRFAKVEAPLLRRLAIHATAARNDLTADEKIEWLVDRCDVNEYAAHHEIFHAAYLAYPKATPSKRMALVQAIHKYQAPESDRYDSDELFAHHLFIWFYWLQEADPGCRIIKKELDAISEQHPRFVQPEHPDFTHWSQVSQVTSPWTANDLLMRPAGEWLPELLIYQPTDEQRYLGNDRRAMLRAVYDAAQNNSSWGLDLADALAEGQRWESDIWYHIITAWANGELDQDCVERVLSHLSTKELHPLHPREIANVLSSLARNPAMAETKELLQAAHLIAADLSPHASASEIPSHTSSVGGVPQYVTWLDKAINHACGKLAQFWTFSIDLWRNQQKVAPASLTAEYREALDAIIQEEGIPGKFGRTVLASHFHFFLAVDERWTLDNLLPLFDSKHDDFQCAWDGFLTWGRISPTIAELMHEKFIAAIPRVVKEFDEHMSARFMQFYTTGLGWLIRGANEDWIIEFFKNANLKAKSQFAFEIEHHLRGLDETGQQEWWNTWLKNYWDNRLKGIPSQLDDEEIAKMLDWVRHLPGVFPEAVEIATRMKPVTLSRSSVLYDISECGLVERYPNELAKFFVHLGKSDTQPWFWHGTWEAIDKLLEYGLQPDLDKGIREIIAKHRLN